MRHRIPLPTSLGDPFHVADAVEAGVGRWRASTPDLARPFRGVRSAGVPATFRALVACYLPRMKEHQRFVGRTAMRLWGLPLPRGRHPDEPLEVAVPRDRTPPKAVGVRGRRLDADRARTWSVHRARVVDPIAAVLSSAGTLTRDQLVCALDALLASADNYPGLVPGRPPVTVADIAERLAEWGAFPGCAKVRGALRLARPGAESPKETETRLLLLRHGLPEPAVQHEVIIDGRCIARVDLAYPALRIAIEYEGDGHRTDQRQWRRDIERERTLAAHGWIVIRLTQHDFRDGGAALVGHVRRAIASRR